MSIRVFSVDDGLGAPVRTKEIALVARDGGRQAGFELEDTRVFRDEERDGAGALGVFTGGPERILGDIARDHQGIRLCGVPGPEAAEGGFERVRRPDAGKLELRSARLGHGHAVVALEHAQDVGGRRLGLVDRRLGADGDGVDVARIDPGRVDGPLGGHGRQRRAILVGIGHRHPAHAHPLGHLAHELCHVAARKDRRPDARPLPGEIDVKPRNVNPYRVNAVPLHPRGL